ncbi:transcriptional protein SWT1 isoform X2 [Anabrus simplex]|uniref:transcriptional protein SWT1 isoform X2 n=1 Tax=Anabrus simplex TaxID=316456 RepID=UPI0035A38A0A
MNGEKMNNDQTGSVARKPSLGYGWVVYPSRSYPSRVYYFNVLTGCSSWENPLKLLAKDEPTNETSAESSKRVESECHPRNAAHEKVSGATLQGGDSEPATLTHLSTKVCSPPEPKSIILRSVNHSTDKNPGCTVKSVSFENSCKSEACDRNLSENLNKGKRKMWRKPSHLARNTNDAKRPSRVHLKRPSFSDGSSVSNSLDSYEDTSCDSVLPNSRSCLDTFPEDRNVLKAVRRKSSVREDVVHKLNPSDVKTVCNGKLKDDPVVRGNASQRLELLRLQLEEQNKKPQTSLRTTDSPLSEPSSGKRLKLSTSPVKSDKLHIGSRLWDSGSSQTASTLNRSTACQQSSVKSAPQVHSKTVSGSNKRVATSPLDYHPSASERIASEKREVLKKQNVPNKHVSSETWPQSDNQRPTGQSKDKSKNVRFSLPGNKSSQPALGHERSRSGDSGVTSSTSNCKTAGRANLAAARMEKLKRSLATTIKEKVEEKKNVSCTETSKKTQECSLLSPKISESFNFKAVDTSSPIAHCSPLKGSVLSVLEPSEPTELALSPLAEDEVMDWEPVEPEKLVRDIYEFRDQVNNQGGMNFEEKLQFADSLTCDSGSIISDREGSEWYIVIDTNVFLGNLAYVEELLGTYVKDFGSPVLIVPWYVLQELDRLKDGRYKAKLATRARKAVTFLHNNLGKHPRLKGQSVSEANLTKETTPDDGILDCCLQKVPRVVLLSNDRNLCNKAVVNNVAGYSATEMKTALEKLNEAASPDENANRSVSKIANDVKNQSSSSTSFSLNKENLEASKADVVLCKLKSSLKELLSHIVEQEMTQAFGKLWIKVVFIKPPWVLVDLFACLIKHWIAVFSFKFSNQFKTHIEELKESLSKMNYGHSLVEVQKIIEISFSLCLSIPSGQYGDQVTKCVQVLDKLRLGCSDAPALWNNQESQAAPVSENIETGTIVELEAVREFLDKIWQAVSFFCAILLEALGLEHNFQFPRPNPFPSMADIEQKLPEMYATVHDITQCLESILDTHPSQLSPQHSAITELHFRLMNFFTSREDPDDFISPELLCKFCLHTVYRVALENGRTQFQSLENMLVTGLNVIMERLESTNKILGGNVIRQERRNFISVA